jgi:cytochrome c-type biogenesis protein CcmH/NrfG
VVVAMFLAASGVLAWMLWRQTGAQEDSLVELARLQDQLHRSGQAAAESDDLRRKLTEVEARLAASRSARMVSDSAVAFSMSCNAFA